MVGGQDYLDSTGPKGHVYIYSTYIVNSMDNIKTTTDNPRQFHAMILIEKKFVTGRKLFSCFYVCLYACMFVCLFVCLFVVFRPTREFFTQGDATITSEGLQARHL